MTRCVHCLKELDLVTKDHVFPSAWYTDNTPQNVQRWTVPSCSECNESLGKAELNLLVRMVPCIDQSMPEISGVRNKVYEAFGIDMGGGIDQKEFNKRKDLARKIFQELLPYRRDMKFFPNFGPHKGFPLETQHAIHIPSKLIISVAEKVFRGAEYKLNGGRLVESPYELKIYHVEKEIQDVERLFEIHGKTSYLGPGFKLERASGANTVLYRATIWGSWIVYGFIDLPDKL